MQSCNGTEFIKQKAVHSPFFWYDVFIFAIKILHLSLYESVPSLCILQNTIFSSSILFFVLFKYQLNKLSGEFSVILFSEDFNNFGCCGHVRLI